MKDNYWNIPRFRDMERNGAFQTFKMDRICSDSNVTYSLGAFSTQPIVIINHLHSELDLTSIIDELVSNKEFSRTSSLFVVVPTADGQDSEDSLKRVNDVEPKRVIKKDNWKYEDKRKQFLPHIKPESGSNELLKVSAKGRRFFWEGVPSAEVPTISKEVMVDDYFYKYITTLGENNYYQTAHTTVDATDTSLDRPCCCNNIKHYHTTPHYRTKSKSTRNISTHKPAFRPVLNQQMMTKNLSVTSLTVGHHSSYSRCRKCRKRDQQCQDSATSIPVMMTSNPPWSSTSIIEAAYYKPLTHNNDTSTRTYSEHLSSANLTESLSPRLRILTISDKPCHCGEKKVKNKSHQAPKDQYIYLKNVKCGAAMDYTYANQTLVHPVISQTTSPIRVFKISHTGPLINSQHRVNDTGCSPDHLHKPCIMFEPKVTTSARVITLTGAQHSTSGGGNTIKATSASAISVGLGSGPIIHPVYSCRTPIKINSGCETTTSQCTAGPLLELTRAPCAISCANKVADHLPQKCVGIDFDEEIDEENLPRTTVCLRKISKPIVGALKSLFQTTQDYKKFVTKSFVTPIPSKIDVCTSPNCRSLTCPTPLEERLGTCKSLKCGKNEPKPSLVLVKGSGITIVAGDTSEHSSQRVVVPKPKKTKMNPTPQAPSPNPSRHTRSPANSSNMPGLVNSCSVCNKLEKPRKKQTPSKKNGKKSVCPCSSTDSKSSSSKIKHNQSNIDCACQKPSKERCKLLFPKRPDCGKVMLSLGKTGPPCAPRRMVSLAVQAQHSCCNPSTPPPQPTKQWRVQTVKVRQIEKKKGFGYPSKSREMVQMEIVGPLGGFAAHDLNGIYTQASVKRTRYNVGSNTASNWKQDDDKKKKKKKKNKNSCDCPLRPMPSLLPTAPDEGLQILPEDFEAARIAYNNKKKNDLFIKSNLSQTTSGFKINAKKKEPEPEWTVEDSIKYFAMTNPEMVRDLLASSGLKYKGGKSAKKNCACDKLTGSSVDCECEYTPKEEEPEGAFRGLKFKMDGKGSGSKGLTGVCCFDVQIPTVINI